MLVTKDPQSQLSDLPFAEFVFDPNHPLLQLSQAIHWDNLLNDLAYFYSPDQGRPTIPLRAQSGTLMLKFIKNLPDREAVHYAEENIYGQRFCDLSPSQAQGFMNPASGLSNFRQAIGTEGMALIQEVLNCAALGKSLKRGDKLILDTTCIPLDIHYPTDIRLLERCRREVIRLLKKAKDLGLQVLYRTYNRTARKIFVRFSKRSKSSEKVRKRVHKQMFQFLRRNFKQLSDLREKATAQLGLQCRTNPKILDFLQNLKLAESKIRIILHQQKLVRQGILRIPNRIVSFHKDHVRPIVRGKFPLETEFGPKVLVAVVRKCVHIVATFHNNVADVTLIALALRWFKTTFGHFPKEMLGDRGFYARWKSLYLKSLGILPGFQERGKSVQTSSSQRRMIRQRLPIEAFISLGKRKFGWNRCRARNPEYESSWISFAAAALNAYQTFWIRSPP